jgi:tetratricopeptide (TPR) repeat protein
VVRGALPFTASVFGLALVVRLIHIWQIRRSPFFTVLMGDARAYDEWARRLAAGDWIGSEVFYQAPLYPYFLGFIYALFGPDLAIVRICQAIVGAAACALVGLAAWRLFSKRAGWIAGIGMAIYAPAIFFDALIQKSVLDVFFVSLALWIVSEIMSGRAGLSGPPEAHGGPKTVSVDTGGGPKGPPYMPVRFLLLGLAMGALSLTRENALVLAAVVLGWILLGYASPARAKGAAAFVVGMAILLVPVAARNYAVGGGFYLTTSQFGPNFYIGNNARSDGTYSSLRQGRGSPEYERRDATELAERALNRRLSPAEVSTYWTDQALDFITSRPLAWLRLLGRKILLLVNAGEMLDTESQASYAEYSWPLKATGWFTHFGVLVPLALVGVWATWADRRRLAIVYALTLAYAASVVMFYVFARYRFPLVPMLIVFVAPGVLSVISSLHGNFVFSRFRGSSFRVFVAAVGALVITNWPMLSTPLMMTITDHNLGAALYDAKRYDEAIASYERAVARRPDYAPSYSNMGAALRAAGQPERAVAAYRMALALQFEAADTHFNLANALLDLDRPQEAAEHFRQAGRQAPSSANIENNLGIALAADGKLAEAAAAFRRALALDPASARAHRNLGDALLSLGRHAEGLEHLRRATELDPGNLVFHYDLAVALLEAQQLPQAVASFRAALAIDPKHAPAHNNLGVALASQGRLDEAIDHFRQALAIQPDYADAQRNLKMALSVRRP